MTDIYLSLSLLTVLNTSTLIHVLMGPMQWESCSSQVLKRLSNIIKTTLFLSTMDNLLPLDNLSDGSPQGMLTDLRNLPILNQAFILNSVPVTNKCIISVSQCLFVFTHVYVCVCVCVCVCV